MTNDQQSLTMVLKYMIRELTNRLENKGKSDVPLSPDLFVSTLGFLVLHFQINPHQRLRDMVKKYRSKKLEYEAVDRELCISLDPVMRMLEYRMMSDDEITEKDTKQFISTLTTSALISTRKGRDHNSFLWSHIVAMA